LVKGQTWAGRGAGGAALAGGGGSGGVAAGGAGRGWAGRGAGGQQRGNNRQQAACGRPRHDTAGAFSPRWAATPARSWPGSVAVYRGRGTWGLRLFTGSGESMTLICLPLSFGGESGVPMVSRSARARFMTSKPISVCAISRPRNLSRSFTLLPWSRNSSAWRTLVLKSPFSMRTVNSISLSLAPAACCVHVSSAPRKRICRNP
jgi:hypothetical protein